MLLHATVNLKDGRARVLSSSEAKDKDGNLLNDTSSTFLLQWQNLLIKYGCHF